MPPPPRDDAREQRIEVEIVVLAGEFPRIVETHGKAPRQYGGRGRGGEDEPGG